jgi:hypothetical protein
MLEAEKERAKEWVLSGWQLGSGEGKLGSKTGKGRTVGLEAVGKLSGIEE